MMEPEEVRRYERHVRALIKAAGTDPAAFAQVVQLAAQLQAGLKGSAGALLDQEFSWADIGRELGLTRQGAHQRWRPARP